MAKSRLPAMKDDDEISPDVLNDVLLSGAKAQAMPSLTPRKEVPATVVAKKPKAKPRSTNAISLPDYVWAWIREEGHKNKEAQNVLMMRFMKQGGAPIDEEDLVDGRRKRWQKEAG
jgi:hypothetical protein